MSRTPKGVGRDIHKPTIWEMKLLLSTQSGGGAVSTDTHSYSRLVSKSRSSYQILRRQSPILGREEDPGSRIAQRSTEVILERDDPQTGRAEMRVKETGLGQ